MNKCRSIFLKLFSLLSLILLGGCQKMGLLTPKGSIAADEKHLLITAVLLMLLIVVPVILLSFIIPWKYRAGNKQAAYDPEWSHSTILEIIWWTIPCIIIGILAVITWNSSHALDPYRPLTIKTKPLIIQAVALEWKWLFIYPEQHIATINFVQMPVNVPVRFLITADAPMNSFQIPQLAGQIYAMAGMQTKLNLIASEIGNYRGSSTNYSGTGFSDMNFIAKVSTKTDFNQWLTSVRQSPKKLTLAIYNQLALASERNLPAYFSGVDTDLFNTIIMKFMMPMKNLPSSEKPAVREMKQTLNAKPKDYAADREFNSRYNQAAQ